MTESPAELSRRPLEPLLALQPGYIPMILFTAWWNAALNAWWPPCAICSVDRDHCDLPVPEAIERTGEHALFV
ncbi:hypothetical protein LZK98_05005 [Sphingomonas cannabina]|uniref:hypothetical protein n=1 Tax=Sphingomonas cannabina TaxID=2899123 RepID=UPI001F2E29D6|nr:hypothetical protein [Sphingomonas cannabina]UIJ46303.1 hypothetical protein LZK98_05005 [Sphingomonas cannabina]